MTTCKHAIFLIIIALALAACVTKPQDPIQVIVVADGKRVELSTEATTVRKVLEQAHIELGEMDRVRPPETFVIGASTVITVTRVTQRFEIETQTVPYEQQIVRDTSIPAGQQRILQAGRNGRLELTYRLTFEDNLQTERIEVKREVVEPPQSEVVLVGVAQMQNAAPLSGTLVYLANNNAYVIRQSTHNRRALTGEGDLDGWVFALSPDGKTLLYTRVVSPSTASGSSSEAPLNTLWTLDTVRADARPQPVNKKLTGVLWADWSPDGRTVAYSTGQPAAGPPGWRANNDLWTAPYYSASGAIGASAQALAPSSGGVYGWWGNAFAWSPHGEWIAMGSTEQVSIINLKNGKRAELATFAAINTYSNWAWTPTVAWTPDSRFVLTVLPGLSPAGQSPGDTSVFDVWALAVDGSFRAKLANEAGMWAAPRPSVGSSITTTHIIFGRAEAPYTSGRSRYTLYVMDRDGSNRTRLFPAEGGPGLEGSSSLGGLVNLAWSPVPPTGGAQVALVYQGDLYRIDVPGGHVQQLTAEGNIERVRWAR